VVLVVAEMMAVCCFACDTVAVVDAELVVDNMADVEGMVGLCMLEPLLPEQV
jgi:hypothetical protein